MHRRTNQPIPDARVRAQVRIPFPLWALFDSLIGGLVYSLESSLGDALVDELIFSLVS